MRFLFTTLHDQESDFYARVGRELEARGHPVTHVTFSPRWAALLGEDGHRAVALTDRMAALGAVDVAAEAERIERQYDTPTLRDVYKTDPPCYGRSEEWCVERTVRHFLAMEQVFDEVGPEVVVPEVGSESIRTVAHLVALDRGVRVLFLFYTIFPQPLRLYENTMHAPIVPPDEVRELTAGERDEIERFIAEFKARAKPIRPYRRVPLTLTRLPTSARHLADRFVRDRSNEYMRPEKWAVGQAKELGRAVVAKGLYRQLDQRRPFVYFPLHVTDDYKIKRVIPHCVDQASIIEQLLDALPHGYDLVLKEHPMSIGRNPVALLRRLRRLQNVQLVDPYTSSHELIQRAEAIAVISSTVGLEALLYEKPVLTLGQPFYAGYGVTLDIDSFREIRDKVPALLDFRPDRELILRFLHAAMRRCYPGAPVLVDDSDENAVRLAESLDRAAREGVAGGPPPVPAGA